ncbi:MAG TPA: LytTR family DNA-binding domain-containing protein [Flavisolibacter sp.]|nr:LytTR family DNA-binding domain-containing protein [Flavisolibacter sp.]
MKLKCILVDDEPLALELLEGMIGKISFLEIRGRFPDPFEAIRFLENETVDLIFLDINLPGINGMELSALLPQETKIVFTTAYSEYALAGYERNTLDYLLKPITQERFLRAALKIKAAFGIKAAEQAAGPEASPVQFFKTGKQIVRLDLGEIAFFEAKGDYVSCSSRSGKVLLYVTMRELEEKLPPHFVRVHHSYILNIQMIRKIEDNQVWLYDQAEIIPVSAKYKSRLTEAIEKRLFN